MNINTYVRKNYLDFIDLYIRTSSYPHLFLNAWARHCEETGIGCTEDQIEALIEKAEDEGEIEEGDIFVGEWYDIPKSRNNPRRQDDFIQTAFDEIEKDGTEGSFTRYVANNFYGENTPQKRKAVAQKIKSDYEKWVRKGKKGRAPFTLTTYRRANFYLNIQKN